MFKYKILLTKPKMKPSRINSIRLILENSNAWSGVARHIFVLDKNNFISCNIMPTWFLFEMPVEIKEDDFIDGERWHCYIEFMNINQTRGESIKVEPILVSE